MPGMDSFTAIAPLIFIFAIMYFLLIRPQQQRMKQHKQMVENLRRGDTVVTAGGMVGRVVKVDDPEITVEIADNVQVRVIKATVSEVRATSSRWNFARGPTTGIRISTRPSPMPTRRCRLTHRNPSPVKSGAGSISTAANTKPQSSI